MSDPRVVEVHDNHVDIRHNNEHSLQHNKPVLQHPHQFPERRAINSIHIHPEFMKRLHDMQSKMYSETGSQQNQGSGNERVRPKTTLLIEDGKQELVAKALADRKLVEAEADRKRKLVEAEADHAIAEIITEMEKLQTENAGYRGDIGTLEQENEKIYAFYALTYERLNTKNGQYCDLETMYAQLQEKYVKLQEDNARLQVKIQAATKRQQLQEERIQRLQVRGGEGGQTAARWKGGGGGGQTAARGSIGKSGGLRFKRQ